MPKKKSIFSQQALDEINSPDRLDELITVTKRSSWVFLSVMILFLLAIISWSFLGHVNQQVTVPCILYPASGGPEPVVSQHLGYVKKLNVKIGQIIKPKENILTLTDRTKQIILRSPYEGRILDIMVDPGQKVTPGTEVALIQPLHKPHPLVAHAFIPMSEGKLIDSGMEAHISVVQASSSKYGYLKAVVTSVSTYPLSRRGLEHVLQNSVLASNVIKGSAPYEAIVRLKESKSNTSGYQWTSAHAYPGKITPGSICQVTIVRKQIRPISLLFPEWF